MTLKQIMADILANGEQAQALYLATDEQISTLINDGSICEDYGYIAYLRREEFRAEFIASL